MKYAPFAVAAAAAVAIASPAAAVTFVGQVTGIDAHSSGNGLLITSAPGSQFTFDLTTVGSSTTVSNLFTIGTDEGAVDWDDFASKNVFVSFDFSAPSSVVGDVPGSSFGFYVPFTVCGIAAGGCGAAEFSGAEVFTFSNGAQLSVELSNVWFTTPGSANVSGKFTLLNAGAVPEASTWAMMLAGFGALGFAMRRRRNVNVSFA